MKVRLAAVALLLFTSGAIASIPTSRQHGAWSVTSISSFSGVGGADGGGDAGVSLRQEAAAAEFDVRWMEENRKVVRVAVRANDCMDEDEDFSAFYAVTTSRWLATSPEALTRRISRDLAIWREQAALACRPGRGLEALREAKLGVAVRDFTDRLAYFGGAR